MKKFRALALGLAFTFVLGAGAACSRSGDSESAPAETTGTETQAAADASAGSEYAGRTVKIGLTGTIYEKIWEPISLRRASQSSLCSSETFPCLTNRSTQAKLT